jgi:CHAD domain-containing protein/CYTH domain-containing protein
VKAPAGLLDQTADRGARRLALGFLDDAAAAHARLEQGADDEALHDLRVALRRLRSTVRAYERHLRGSIGKKDERRLRALADATSEARDLEVHAAWMSKHVDGLPHHHRAGAARSLHHLRSEKDKADQDVRREVAKDFGKLRWRLTKQLRFYRVEVDVDQPQGGPRMSAVLSRLVADAAERLERRLRDVRDIDDQDEAHRARIAAKRLRYLVEPFTGELAGAAEIVKRIKRLQDALGEMHDADVLLSRLPDPGEDDDDPRAHDARDDEDRDDADDHGAADDRDDAEDRDASSGDGDGDLPAEDERDEAHGIRAVREALEEERVARFAYLEMEWLHGAAAPFFEAVHALAETARTRGEPDTEIERKYLLKRMPAIKHLPVRIQELDQGYLPGDRLAERIRRVREGGEVKYYRTVKLGRGLTRTEVEEETTAYIFRKMWPLTRGKRVRKRRYKVSEGGFTWEIDRFRDRRLVLAEVELPSEDVDPPLPRWLQRELVRDVTDEGEYANINLAK